MVLDTNIVLDLVVFDDPLARPLRAAIEAGSVTLLADAAGLAELRRVLAYPEFKLDDTAQADAYAWYASRVETCDAAGAPPSAGLPRCRDPDDQKFLELAWSANAAWLVTKDKALLELARRVAKLGRFSVTPPGTLIGRLCVGTR